MNFTRLPANRRGGITSQLILEINITLLPKADKDNNKLISNKDNNKLINEQRKLINQYLSWA